jgi:aminoglycoside phosphotransferase (APT) family kinase protein
MEKLVDRTGDPAIPTLATVLDPAELAKELSLLSFPHWQWDASQEIQLRVLRWKRASRCTFEIVLGSAGGSQALIGKVYAEDRSDVYQTMQEIRRAGFGSEEEFSIPRPVAYLAPLRLLLYEKVPGTRAKYSILSPNESDRVLAAERCARWLARFQALAPSLGPVFHLHDYLMSLEGWWRCLDDLDRPVADKAGRLFEQLTATALDLGNIDMCASHGTYTAGQVLLAEDRTVTFDWDTYNVADPFRDVARFLVELQRLAWKYLGSHQALDGIAEVFLDTYLATAHSDTTRRLPVHQAAIFFERAKHDVDKQARRWRERAEVMLDAGLRVLGLD